ncbi:hypothetical protein INT45_006126, partial [Circinella minor]
MVTHILGLCFLFWLKLYKSVFIHYKYIILTAEERTMNLAGIEKAFNKQLKESPLPGSDVEWDKPFYIGDLEELRRQHLKWKTLLPRIEPFYAIKCNPDPIVAKFLASLGVGFDCASQSEIQQVLEMGLSEDQIVYSHPHKNPSSIQYAAQNNVSLMSIDSETELYKIKKLHPDAKLLLRVLVDDKYCAIPQGIKFGAMEDDIEHLLSVSKELKLNVVGACFHVGSGCTNAEAYYDAVCRARRVFDLAKSMDIEMNILNIGGGFNESGITEGGATFEKAAAVLGPAVDEMFPSNIRVIGEPGRFFVGSAFVLCVSVIGRQTVTPGADEMGKDVKSGKQSSKYM